MKLFHPFLNSYNVIGSPADCSNKLDSITGTVYDGGLDYSGTYEYSVGGSTLDIVGALRMGNNQWDLTFEFDAAQTTTYNLPSSSTEYMRCLFYISTNGEADFGNPLQDLESLGWEVVDYSNVAVANTSSTSSSSSFTLFAVLLTALFLQA